MIDQRERQMNPPSLEIFQKRYRELGITTPSRINALVWHDINNTTHLMMIALDVAHAGDPELVSFIHSNEFAQRSTEVKLGVYETLIKHASEIPHSEVDVIVNRIIDRAQAIKKLFSIFSASVFFLEDPTLEKFKKLISEKTDLQTIAQAFGLSVDSEVTMSLNGAEAIILINMITNAIRHKTGGQVTIKETFDRKGISVENHSLRRVSYNLPDTRKKQWRSTGFGTPIMDIYATGLSNVLVTASSRKATENDYFVKSLFRRMTNDNGGFSGKEREASYT